MKDSVNSTITWVAVMLQIAATCVCVGVIIYWSFYLVGRGFRDGFYYAPTNQNMTTDWHTKSDEAPK